MIRPWGGGAREIFVRLAMLAICAAGLRAAAGDAFYYHDGRPVALNVDPARVTVELKPSAARGGAALAQAAAALGPDFSLESELKNRPGFALFRADPAANPAPRAASPRKSSLTPLTPKTPPANAPAAAMRAALASPAVARVFPVYANPSNGVMVLIGDEIKVRLRPGADAAEARAHLAAQGLALVKRNQYEPEILLLRAVKTPGDEILSLANKLARDKTRFVWAEPNFYPAVQKYFIPNDTLFPNQWHLRNTGQSSGTVGADINAALAWDTTRGAPGIVIALLDDGVDLTHPDLTNRWTNPGETAGDGVDNDGNGFVDDVSGWDFWSNDNNPGHDFADDSEGHGTSTSGIAAAVGNNALGVSGLAPECKFFMCKIFHGDGDDSYAGDAEVGDALRYAAQFADVISNSWGGGLPSSDIRDAIFYARSQGRGGRGCVVLAASGNETATAVSYPAAYPMLMAVGASDRTDKRFSYSNYGLGLSFVSPSGNYTTDISGAGGYDATEYTSTFGGTSSATPLAAAAAALLLSKNAALTSWQVQALLNKTSVKIQSGAAAYNAAGYSNEYGFGRLDAAAALAAAPAPAGNDADADDQYEENDASAQAVPLGPAMYKGMVAQDEDWFKVLVPAGKELTAAIHFVHAQNNLGIEILNSDLVQTGYSDGAGDIEEASASGGAEQEYFVRVFGAAYAHGGYVLKIAVQDPDDIYEQNDEPDAAALVALGDYTNLKCYDDDFYRVNLAAGEPLGVRALFSHAAGDIDMILYDQNMNMVGYSDSAADNETINFAGAPGVTACIIHIYGYGGATNSYALSLRDTFDDAFEENDDTAHAARVGFGAFAELDCYDDDYYRIDVAPNQGLTARIDFTHASGDLDMELLDANLAVVGTSESIGNFETITHAGGAANATYYVHAYGYQGLDSQPATNAYTMTLTSEAGFPNYAIETTARPTDGGAIRSVPAPGAGGAIAAGTTVTLTALPAQGWRFADWAGDTQDSTSPAPGTLTFALTADRSIAAFFEQTRFSLDLEARPRLAGAAAAFPAPGPDGLYAENTLVHLIASPNAPNAFAGWTGDVTDSNASSTLLMTQNSVVIARFDVPEDAYEENDDRAHAAPLAPGNYGLLKCADADWFRVVVPGGGWIRAEMHSFAEDGDLKIELFDAQGGPLDASNGAADNEIVRSPSGADESTYFIRVAGVGNAVNVYELSVFAGGFNAAQDWTLYR